MEKTATEPLPYPSVVYPNTPSHVPTTARADAARLALHERARLRAAAARATQAYPNPVGELLARELASFEDLGCVVAADGLVNRLIDHLMKTPIPVPGRSP